MSDYWEYLANTGQTANYVKRTCEKCGRLLRLPGGANIRDLPISAHCKNCNGVKAKPYNQESYYQ